MTDSAEAVLNDGTVIPLTISGSGPALLIPARAEPRPEEEAVTMRAWGADPDLGPNLEAALSQSYRVIAADYEGHRTAHPAPETLTPENVATDFLAIANAARADRFGYYGPRWGNVQVRIGAPLAEHESELTAAGWTVKVLPGLEHLGAMQGSAVVPLLKKWLDRVAA